MDRAAFCRFKRDGQGVPVQTYHGELFIDTLGQRKARLFLAVISKETLLLG